MFDKEYTFKGKHGFKVKSMVKRDQQSLSVQQKFPIFERNLDVYLIAPIVGFMYGRTSEIDNDPNYKPTDIFPQQLSENKANLLFNFHLIMLLAFKYEPDEKERINKAFNYYNNDKLKDDEILYNSYVLGGVDILYEKLIENSLTIEDCLNNLYDFIEDFDERYGEKVNKDDLSKLFLLADV